MGSNRRAVIAAVSILLAVVAGVAVFMYTSNADTRAQKNEDLVDAFVASSDIPKGMTGQQAIASSLIQKQQVRRVNRPDTALPDTAAIATQVAGSDIAKGQFVLTNTFVDQAKASSGLADLAAGMQALTISVDDLHGVAGFVQPGDRVNLIYTSKLATAVSPPPPALNQASFVVQNVRVLAVGRQAVNSVPTTTAPGAAAVPTAGAGLVTLELSALDAEKVALASQGTIYLTLVPKGFKPELVAPVTDIINLGPAPSHLVG